MRQPFHAGQMPFIVAVVARAFGDRGGAHDQTRWQVAGFAVELGEAGEVAGFARGVDFDGPADQARRSAGQGSADYILGGFFALHIDPSGRTIGRRAKGK